MTRLQNFPRGNITGGHLRAGLDPLPSLPLWTPQTDANGGGAVIQKALEKGYSEHPKFSCCTDDMPRGRGASVENDSIGGFLHTSPFFRWPIF